MLDLNEPGPSKRRKVKLDDPHFSEVINLWMDEEDDCYSENSDAEVIESDHNSESELELEDGPTDNITEDRPSEDFYLDKNGDRWYKKSLHSSRSKTIKKNIITQLPGPKGPLKEKLTEVEIWNNFFCEDMLLLIIKFTNQKLNEMRKKHKDTERAELRNLDITELRSFIGLLFYAAVFRSNHENVSSLFATDGTGREIFRCVTHQKRFLNLLLALRFDDASTRNERKKDDPTAAISELFSQFISNCQSAYSISEYSCIDEMLVSFRGRSKFKIYLPNKPCKYGLKLMALTDARNNYFLNGYIYCGKGSDGRSLPEDDLKLQKPTQSVIRLVKPIEGSNRNVTADNWFTSMEVVKKLQEKKLTYVGTVKKTRREIPPEFLSKKRAVGSSLYSFSTEAMMVSFVPKKHRCVVLLSSMHTQEGEDEKSKKPEIISFYNMTKGGVDDLDEKCANYCTGRRTRRWPMAIFFRLLDISAVNSFVIHCSHGANESRLMFMKNLALQLVKEELQRRVHIPQIRLNIKAAIHTILGTTTDSEKVDDESHKLSNRKYCHKCPPKIRRKTSTLCCCCKRPVCLQCSNQICVECKPKIDL